jgi:hypothetical protein
LDTANKSVATAIELDKEKTATPSFLQHLTALARTKDAGIALGLLVLGFATRLIAVPASLWEWDDILFARALHRYDLSTHSPHPPGFPILVVMHRIAFWALNDEHRALTTVALIFVSLLAPALFFLYREVFQDRRIAVAGALVGSFAPNVWIHGGAGRSDGVALTLGVVGLTLIIRGLRSRRSLIAGCALFGLGMGVRVTLLPVMGPMIAMVFIAWLWRREWKLVAASLATGTAGVLAWFAPFIYIVTWSVYRSVMDAHSQYTLQTDSIFASHDSASLSYRFTRFFMDVWGPKWIADTIYAFTILGLIALSLKRQWRVIGWMALAFLPYMAFTLTLNIPFPSPLYSLPYIPFFTGLAACGLVKLPDLIFSSEWRRTREYSGLLLAAMVVIGIAGWTYPIIKLIHREPSPAVKAISYLKKKIDVQHDALDFGGNFSPHVAFYLPQIRLIKSQKVKNAEANLINPMIESGRIYALTDYPVAGELLEEFHWTSNNLGARRLRRLSLGRYFDTYVTNITASTRKLLLSGWYQEESEGIQTWRWTGQQAKVALFNTADSMILRLRGMAARNPSGRRPTMVLRLNGAEIYRQTLNSYEVDQSITVKTDPQFMWYTLTIELDQAMNPSKLGLGGDSRDLGFRCDALDWTPAPGAKPMAFASDQFLGSGWYGVEKSEDDYYRWSQQRATVYLPPIEGDGQLEFALHGPKQADGTVSDVTIEVSGQVIDKFRPDGALWIAKTIRVPEAVHRRARAELVISMDKPVALQNGDTRQVGAAFFYIGWRPSE